MIAVATNWHHPLPMKLMAMIAIFALAGLAMGEAGGFEMISSAPLDQVLNMLSSMKAKVLEDIHEEQVQYSTYHQWCITEQENLNNSITKANLKELELMATIEKASTDASQLSSEMQTLQADISTWTGDKSAAQQVRTMERNDFVVAENNYNTSISAVFTALDTVRTALSGNGSTGNVSINMSDISASSDAGASLLQLSTSPLVPSYVRSALESYLQTSFGALDDPALSGPPAEAKPAAYDFTLMNVVLEMLDKLKQKFEAEGDEMRKTEKNKQAAYDRLAYDMDSQVTQGNKNLDYKNNFLSQAQQTQGAATAQLDELRKSRSQDKDSLSDVSQSCLQKTSAFEERSQLRVNEVGAIDQAVDIISDASAEINNNVPKLLELRARRSKTVMLQIRSSNRGRAAWHQACALLSQEGLKLNSSILLAVAKKLDDEKQDVEPVPSENYTSQKAARDNATDEIIAMIEDLITHLTLEAENQAAHQSWCHRELNASDASLTLNRDKLSTVVAFVELTQANIAQLEQDQANKQLDIEGIMEARRNATKLRDEESHVNQKVIDDAMKAQDALLSAIQILTSFYKKAAASTAFLQEQVSDDPAAPAIFDKIYVGQQDAQTAVVTILKTLNADFVQLQAETEQAEDAAVAAYKSFVRQTTSQKAMKQIDIKILSEAEQDQKNALGPAEMRQHNFELDLNASIILEGQLHEHCDVNSSAFELRKAKRMEEVKDLETAKDILSLA